MSFPGKSALGLARLFLVCAVLAGALAAAGLLWIFRGEAGAALHGAMAWTRSAGPWIFFGAMATVPLPLAWFTVPAGELFAARLTLPGVIAAAMGAVIVQLSLSYGVARYAVRPWLAGWLTKRGYVAPQVTRENAAGVVLMVRLLPGPPMILGSCLLALAETPFAIYVALSALVALPWVCAGVVLGRGILAGDAALAATGAGLLAALVIGVKLFSRRRRA